MSGSFAEQALVRARVCGGRASLVREFGESEDVDALVSLAETANRVRGCGAARDAASTSSSSSSSVQTQNQKRAILDGIDLSHDATYTATAGSSEVVPTHTAKSVLSALQKNLQSHTRPVLLSGPAGSGKTFFLQQLAKL